jgi:hypothetical protein
VTVNATTSHLINATTECVPYTYAQAGNDSMLKASRTMIILAMLFAFGAGCTILLEWLCCNIPCAGCLQGLAYGAAVTCSGLVYVIYGSHYCGTSSVQAYMQSSCSFGVGSSYNIAAMALYMIAWVLLCCTPEPDPLRKQCCS